VDETHPNIDAVEKMIAIRRSLDHKVYDLAVIDLNLRESDFIAQLHDIGKQV
jgi:hypothetical protein